MENYNVYYIFSSICKDSLIFPVRYLYFLRTMSPRPRGKKQPAAWAKTMRLYFLNQRLIQKAKVFCFLQLLTQLNQRLIRGDIAIVCWESIRCLLHSYKASNPKNEGSLLYPTFKVEENKVPLFFLSKA